LAGRLVGGYRYAYIILARGSKQAGISQCICKVCMNKAKPHTGKSTKKFTTVYCTKCDIGLCMDLYFDVYGVPFKPPTFQSITVKKTVKAKKEELKEFV
jgi:hypothetical protein